MRLLKLHLKLQLLFRKAIRKLSLKFSRKLSPKIRSGNHSTRTGSQWCAGTAGDLRGLAGRMREAIFQVLSSHGILARAAMLV